MAENITLPELGENVESGSVAKVLVAVGDSIKKDQPVLEVETDKAVVEVPSNVAGVVSEVKTKEGATINVGDVILVIDSAGGGSGNGKEQAEAAASAPAAEEPEDEAVEEQPAAPAQEEAPPKAPPKKESTPKQDTPPPKAAEDKTETESAPPKKEAPREGTGETEPALKPFEGRTTVAAAPSVRRFARQIGVDIDQVEPEEGSTRISMEAVKAHARKLNEEARPAAPGQPAAAALPLPNFEKWGHVEREPMSTIRRRTAERLSAAWNTIPHVTQHDKADITDLEAFRKTYGKRVEAEGVKLTATAILVKVLAAALKRFPQFNASVDVENNELIQKYFYNIGVAVDTEYGLLVPVLKDVDRKNVTEIAVELNDLADRARERKTTLDEMQGACCTVTNLGGIGGTGFSPIVNPPEVAILGVSRSRTEPVYRDGQFVPRTMLPLSLSYDHRVIDGADAARFARWMCDALEQPLLTLLEG